VRRDVRPHLVDQTQRAHGHAEAQHGLVDILHSGASFEQQPRLNHVGHQNAIDQEPRAILDHQGELADFLDEAHHRLSHFPAGFLPQNNLHQLHAMHRIKEVQPNDPLGLTQPVG
jgi:hypothetical protein